MPKKKLTKKQKQEMFYNAVLIAEGSKDPTAEMSYVQAWQYLVTTGEVWKLQGWMCRAAQRMLSDGTIKPAPPEETHDEPQDNGDEQ